MPRITIIDDDVDFVENTAAVLRKQGYAVTVLYSVDGAAEALSRDRPDILILDVMFPDNPVAGFDLARQIRRTKAIEDLPIILLTGINQEFPMDFSREDIDSAWMPVQEFMKKPAKMPDLLDKMSQLLKKR